MSESAKVAYFSMEIGLDAEMPTYSGGLGILAGDTIRAAADFRVPMVAMTLLHRKGYFYQRLDPSGWQTEQPAEWVVDDFVKEMPQRTCVAIEGRSVHLRAWKFDVEGIGGSKVPVYFLDADLPENSDWDRRLTDHLYGGDRHYRLCQEVILGIGGVRMLRALGYDQIERFHMNEGHAALLSVRLLEEEAEKAGRDQVSRADIESVRKKCIFTTHTPVPAGHDQFPLDLVTRVLGSKRGFIDMKDMFCVDLVEQVLGRRMAFFEGKAVFKGENNLNMTFLALNLSHYVNGVAKKHGEVSRTMFGEHVIDSITNGVHAATWTSEPFRSLYDRHIAGWRQDNFSLRYALGIPKEEIWNAHMQAKKTLLRYVNHETNAGLDECFLTIGFARRAAAYKRGDLLFSDIDRLRAIASKAGKIQVIYAGKAHPQDQAGKELIKRIFQARDQLAADIKVVYLENYDMDLGKLITAGVDLWLNTPVPPLEASGTSGMKAALNGVPSLSVLDGWWIEGHIEGVTGWSIGENGRGENVAQDRSGDAGSLYDKLDRVVIPSFYNERERFIEVMRHAIALNGSFFNTHRMIQQYVLNAYFL
jgi:starch phosphorylase